MYNILLILLFYSVYSVYSVYLFFYSFKHKPNKYYITILANIRYFEMLAKRINFVI